MSKRIVVGAIVASLLGLLGVGLPTDTPRVGAQSDYVSEAINHAADSTGLSRRFLWCLAGRESTYRPWAVGDNGAAHGLMQFRWGTWNAYAPRYGFAGYSPYDAWAAAHVAAGMIADGLRQHWPPARYCGDHRWP